jgi:uncharacterized protein Yka (UPF0111/DUF47 family)
MNDKEKNACRLSLLDEVILSQADRESILTEIEDLDRILVELEEFAQETPWVSAQIQPGAKKA